MTYLIGLAIFYIALVAGSVLWWIAFRRKPAPRCEDCRFDAAWVCVHPHYQYVVSPDFVAMPTCQQARTEQPCGPSGKFFQPKGTK